MLSRREFLSKSALTAGFLSLSGVYDKLSASKEFKRVQNLSPEEVAGDEDFWSWVRESFTLSSSIINLNNGGVSPQPKVVQDAHIENYRFCNEVPAYNMWRILDEGREPLRARLAAMAGCSPEEIAINRNS